MNRLYLVLALTLYGCGSSDPSAVALNASPTVNVGCTTASSGFASGSGTAGDPYTICSTAQLAAMHTVSSKSFSLSNDLDMSGVSYVTASGVVNFAGNSHTISHLTVSGASFTGLVTNLTGSLNNLTVTNLSLTGGASPVGLVAYTPGATIANVSVRGTASGTGTVGCLVGQSSNSTITNVTATCTLTSTGDTVGGIVGASTSDVINGATSVVNIHSVNNAGGLLGYGQLSTVSNSSVGGSYILASSGYSGGAIGYGDRVSLISVSADAVTDVFGSDTIGGLAGFIGSSVSPTKSYLTNCTTGPSIHGGTNAGRTIGWGTNYISSGLSGGGTLTGTPGANSL